MSMPPSQLVNCATPDTTVPYLPTEILFMIAKELVALLCREREALSRYAAVRFICPEVEATNFATLTLNNSRDILYLLYVLWRSRVEYPKLPHLDKYIRGVTYRPDYAPKDDAGRWITDVKLLHRILRRWAYKPGFLLTLGREKSCIPVFLNPSESGITLHIRGLQFLPCPVFTNTLSVEHLHLNGRIEPYMVHETEKLTPEALTAYLATLPAPQSASFSFYSHQWEAIRLGPTIRNWSQTLKELYLSGPFDPNILWSHEKELNWPALETFRLELSNDDYMQWDAKRRQVPDTERLGPFVDAFARALQKMPQISVARFEIFIWEPRTHRWSLTYASFGPGAPRTLLLHTLPWEPSNATLGLFGVEQSEQELKLIKLRPLKTNFFSQVGFLSREQFVRESTQEGNDLDTDSEDEGSSQDEGSLQGEGRGD